MDTKEAAPVETQDPKPQYEPPTVAIMDESEVLSAFQVTAAGATMWWTS